MDPQVETPPLHHTLARSGLGLPVPRGWQVLTGGPDLPAGAVAALVPSSWPQEAGFRPSLVAVEVPHPSPGPSVQEVLTRAMSLVLAAPDTHVLALDTWSQGGRRLRWVVGQDGLVVVHTQWVWMHGDLEVSVTSSVDLERFRRVQPALDAVVEGATWREEPHAGAGRGPGAEPARDLFWTARGRDLEDLSRIALLQAPAPGPVSADRTAVVEWMGARRVPHPHPDLVAAGLVDARGRDRDTGQRWKRVMAGADRTVRVEAAAGLLPLSVQAWVRGGDTVLVATDGLAPWVAAPAHGDLLRDVPQRLHLVDLPTVALPGFLASWLGVGPAWSVALEPHRIPVAELSRRVADPTAPVPVPGDPLLQHVWDRLGALWTLDLTTTGGERTGVAAAYAQDCGHYRVVHEDDDTVVLRAMPSATVWDLLTALVATG